MAVSEGDRGEGKFTVLVKANNLCVHTIKICMNENIFLPEYRNALTNDIIRTAKDIFIMCWTANNIMVKDADDRKERVTLQKNAARECNNLLAMIQIAQKLFHLKLRKVKHWGLLTIETRKMIRNWIESDIKRYEKL